jgi:hypothetical protein
MKVLAFLMLLGPVCAAQTPTAAPSWPGWDFLLGEWVGAGTGTPGEGSGGFTFHSGLDDRILIRENHAEYPPSGSRPAFSHKDLMVVSRSTEGTTNASYWDNEGHEIHYVVTLSPDSSAIVFQTGHEPGKPAFRMTYTRKDTDRVSILFEIAPPSTPGKFGRYIDAEAVRVRTGERKP